jgi:hypothetical protein
MHHGLAAVELSGMIFFLAGREANMNRGSSAAR